MVKALEVLEQPIQKTGFTNSEYVTVFQTYIPRFPPEPDDATGASIDREVSLFTRLVLLEFQQSHLETFSFRTVAKKSVFIQKRRQLFK